MKDFLKVAYLIEGCFLFKGIPDIIRSKVVLVPEIVLSMIPVMKIQKLRKVRRGIHLKELQKKLLRKNWAN